MIDLGAFANSAIAADITAPVYLVRILLSDSMALSTRNGFSFQGDFFEPGSISIESIRTNGATIQIDNHDYRYTNGALRGSFLRNPVQIYLAYALREDSLPPYVTPGYWPEDYVVQGDARTTPVLIFDGVISGTPSIGDWITIECARTLPRKFPSVKIRPPIANHLPPIGAVLNWGGSTYRIES